MYPITRLDHPYQWEPETATITLDGFVDWRANVTYEAFSFRVEWVLPNPTWRHDAPNISNLRRAKIYERNGGGWSFFIVEKHLALALYELLRTGADKAAFHMCLGLRKVKETDFGCGEIRATTTLKTAFVEGRLKKRKNRGQSSFKVWIEPKQERATP